MLNTAPRYVIRCSYCTVTWLRLVRPQFGALRRYAGTPPPRNPILAGKSVWFFPLREKGGFLENTASMYMYRECTARRHARYSKGELLSILFLPRAKARALASADHPLHRGPASGSCGAGGGRVSSRSSSMSSASAPRPMRPPFSAQAMCAPLFAPRPSRFVEEQGGCRSACVAVVAPRR